MKNIWKIFQRDLQQIQKNVIAMIVIIGITVVPCLYAWFNIAASWDPYENTGNLKVAVASVDEGYEGSIIPIKLTLGDQVLSALRENTQLEWVFTTKSKAMKGVKSGKYYAAIVIPEDFSRNMMSVFTSDIQKPEITYYSNAKENAIAPKVTDKGATAIQTQVNEVFIETLVRYGNRYQADKAAAVNSLFGGENVVDIATPEIPQAERWSDLDRLNKERDLVGIYLSAHPLDEYAVVLEYVCNTHMAELEDKTALVGREITMGGIVTSVRRGISKNGNPYGIAKIEDYSGSAELPFFGNDWVTYQGYLGERTFLYIKARCQPKQWRQDELELKITSMELLPDVKEKLIEKITILIPLGVLNKALVTELAELTKERPGTTELYFKVTDPESKMTLDLVSRPVKLSVGRELISYLKERPELDFRIN